jgi:hypothetical protein
MRNARRKIPFRLKVPKHGNRVENVSKTWVQMNDIKTCWSKCRNIKIMIHWTTYGIFEGFVFRLQNVLQIPSEGTKNGFYKIAEVIFVNKCFCQWSISTQCSNLTKHICLMLTSQDRKTKRKNSVPSFRKRTMPTERPPLVSEVSANFLRIEGVTWSAWQIPTAVFSVF